MPERSPRCLIQSLIPAASVTDMSQELYTQEKPWAPHSIVSHISVTSETDMSEEPQALHISHVHVFAVAILPLDNHHIGSGHQCRHFP